MATIIGKGTNNISVQLPRTLDLLIMKFMTIYKRQECAQAQEPKFNLQKIPTANIMGSYQPNSGQCKDTKRSVCGLIFFYKIELSTLLRPEEPPLLPIEQKK